ncbi:MAG: MarR family transcriptional regulator [Erysipelotrichaceae bacterium]|nr:MarR family transcriptional regulator [Erysipelotrichaceae bacterium]
MDAIQVLGLTIQFSDWDKQNKVPLYILNTFMIKKAIISNINCIALIPYDELPTLVSLKKQIETIQKVENLPVFLKLEYLSDFRKESFFNHGISFILTDKIVYLPFMYTLITNSKFYSKKGDPLTNSTQLLFMWILYQNTDKFYISDAIDTLHFSNMTITRACRQLITTQIFQEHKNGRKIYLTTEFSKKELFNQMKSYLKTPVMYTGYINKSDINHHMILSGESALGYYSFLNPPRIPVYAISKANIKELTIYDELVYSDNQVEIEVYRYDPFLFSKDNKIIDILSLVISLLDNYDERIEIERDLLLDLLFKN